MQIREAKRMIDQGWDGMHTFPAMAFSLRCQVHSATALPVPVSSWFCGHFRRGSAERHLSVGLLSYD
jgi:hypothetical protein